MASESDEQLLRRVARLQEERVGTPLTQAERERAFDVILDLIARGGDPWELPRMATHLLDGGLDPRRVVRLIEHADAAGQLAVVAPAVADAVEGMPLAEAPKVARKLREVLDGATPYLNRDVRRQLLGRMRVILGEEEPIGPQPGEAWADAARLDLSVVANGAAWLALCAHSQGADSARPSGKWQKRAAELVEGIGRADFAARFAAWTALVEKPKALKTQGWGHVPPIGEENTRALTVLVWAAGAAQVAESADAIGDLATVCFSKIAGFGPVSAKIGNACVWALGAMPGVTGVTHLSRLKVRIKYNVALRLIERALGETAARAGITVADLEELGVPRLGLDDDGAADVALGEWTAQVRLGRRMELSWAHATKKSPKGKTPPKDAKAAPEWKDLKKRLADIDARAAIERYRLENMWLAARTLPWSDFEPRYLRQPLVAAAARRLLWNVGDEIGLWRDGALRTLGGEALQPAPDARVRLWHPLDQPADELAVWQDYLEQHGVVQPFKQAHREVYTLDAAERDNVSFSDRFAGHIIRQHQFAALLKQRGWQFRLMGAFDSHNTPTVNLPTFNMQAELSVDYPGQADEATSASGIYVHIRTDQVRFTSGGRALALAEVPPLVFSELMRDIDLFVSVTSIGNDPAWRSSGDRGYGAYWLEYADAPLSPSGVTRREVLRRILPRTPLHERAAILADARHLLVRGDLASYRIHLGSGMVFVVSSGAHLPLPAPELEEEVALPFDDDWLLGAILAKAFALADDKRLPAELRALL